MRADGRPLFERLKEAPVEDESGRGKRALERVRAAIKASGLDTGFSGEGSAFLRAVFAGSSFLFGLAERYPELLLAALNTAPETHFEEILAATSQEAALPVSTRDIMRVLRRGKTQIAFLLALADLGGVWDVEEITRRLTAAADCFVGLAVNFLLLRAAQAGRYFPRDPVNPEIESGLIVLGMGKYGAFELNYSSDIDLIVFFARETPPLAAGVEPASFYIRLARDLVHLLQERTGDGYVFRTDLRLRPDPGSTQAAISTEAAFRYYESRGQNWERAALIKARPVAGDIAAGEAFLTGLGPYIWRKYLDYNAIADIHAMKRQIHAARGHDRIAIAGHNIKLGRGGIREIEFFVQSQQLIAGGRQPALRTKETVKALGLLAEYGWIGAEVRDELTAAYWHLRRIEHRLQMIADQQTHSLPVSHEGLGQVARFAGYSQLNSFQDDLRHHMQNVERHYAALFETGPELTPQRVPGNLVFTGDADDPGTVETLGRLGFKNAPAAIAAVKGWHFGRYRAMRSERAREILTEFTPALLEAFGDTGDPDLALSTFDTFLGELPAALQLFSTLRANPELLLLLARIMGSAPRLARILGRRRRLMDAILDPGFAGERPVGDDLKTIIQRDISEAVSYEEQLNRARISGQEQSFHIGVELLSRRMTPTEAGVAYSILAEALIGNLLMAVQVQYGSGLPPPAIVGMGKLGGFEMMASSDLDLIVVYDASPEAAPFASNHYARLTQRLISGLSAPTPEGVLYAVDMRLRPSGKSGPVAVRLDSFSSYQRKEAWTWEHLALTRARLVAGPKVLRERLEAEIHEVLTMPRDRLKAASDVHEMRARVHAGKGTSGLWQTKTHKGGLIDAEFVAQYLQIVHASGEPKILNQNTVQAYKNLMEAGILKAAPGKVLIEATTLYQAVAQVLRLCTEGSFNPAAAPKDMIALLTETAGTAGLDALQEALRKAYGAVDGLFSELVF